MKRSKDGDKLCGGVDAQPASLEVFLVARDDAVCIRGRCSLVEDGILEVREVELEGLDQNRVGDWRHCEHREEVLELLMDECSPVFLTSNVDEGQL